MGAGLPLELPELAAGYPNVALISILSDARGVSILLKKWSRKGCLPDAIVIEHPRYADGHLGAPKPEDLADARFDFTAALQGVFKLFRDMDIAPGRIPLIVSGGINSHEKVMGMLVWGASAVQVGRAFAVTEEGDAHPNFKKVLAEARPEDIVTFMSVAGLPARAVMTPWLANYLKRENKLQAVARADPNRCAIGLHCLTQCGLRDGMEKAGQFCIDSQRVAALKGDVNNGMFFRGSETLPFGREIRPAQDLIDNFLTDKTPQSNKGASPSICR